MDFIFLFSSEDVCFEFVWLQIADSNGYIYIYVSSTEPGPLLMLMYIKVDAVFKCTTE